MKKKILFFTVAMIFISCNSHKGIITAEENHDSKEIRLDSIFKSHSVKENNTRILQEVDSNFLANIGIVSPPSRAWLLHDAHEKTSQITSSKVKCDTLMVIDTIIKYVPVTKTKTITVEVNVLRWWQRFLIGSGIILYIIVLVFIIFCRGKNIIRNL